MICNLIYHFVHVATGFKVALLLPLHYIVMRSVKKVTKKTKDKHIHFPFAWRYAFQVFIHQGT